MAKEKSKAELLAENRYLRRTNTAQAIASIVNNAIRWTGVVFISWCGYQSINAMAGKQTAASILISLFGNLTVSQSLAYILGAGGVIYGLSERKLRQGTVKRLQKRNQDLEGRLDPGRTSSKLTETGETHPRDQE